MLKKMDTGITNRLNFSVLFGILIIFLISMRLGYSQNQDCQLIKIGTSIIPSDFPLFEESLNSFYSDSSDFDYIHIRFKGGGYSILSRFYKDQENNWVIVHVDSSGKSKEFLSTDINCQLECAFNNIDTGEYMNFCEYTSLNITHLYLIKKAGTQFFVLDSGRIPANEINNIEIKNSVFLIAKIEEIIKPRNP